MTQHHNSQIDTDAARHVSLPCEGGCTCGSVRYRLLAKPLIVHGFHCSLCQRQTGSAFAINALVEVENVEVLSGEIDVLKVTTPSGLGQTIACCAKCHVAVWSCYHKHELNERIRFLRVGTLDDPTTFPPDVHIFTSTKLPRLPLPKKCPGSCQIFAGLKKQCRVTALPGERSFWKLHEPLAQTNAKAELHCTLRISMT